jgi:DNA ligase-associated metallophosphoesterase
MIMLSGLAFQPDPSGALYCPDYRTLLVADLHLEKGSSYARFGQHLPPYDTRATLASLAAVCVRLRPERIISLGDSFHDGEAGSRLAADDLDRIRRLTEHHETIWLTGNHDRTLPRDIGGIVADEIVLGGVSLRHEPSPTLSADAEIAGHLHPVAAVVRRGTRLRARCFATDGRRLIMPAFGAYTGGLNVRSAAFSGLFPTARFAAWMLGRSAVYPFPARVLLPDA